MPAAHCTQGPPLGPDDPELHVQSSTESLPDGECVRLGQLVHVDDAAVENVPAHRAITATKGERHDLQRIS